MFKIKNFKVEILVKLAFLSFFFLLALFTFKIGLYLDDANLAFPVFIKDYKNHFINYTYDNGFFRPFGLVYYYFIYTVFFSAPWLSHLFPLFLFILTCVLIYKTLVLQKLSHLKSFLISCLVLTLPFVAESISWFAANISIIVLFLFFLQVYLIEKKGLDFKNIFFVFLLQFLATFIYETTIFTPLTLTYLFLLKDDKRNKFKEKVKKYLFLLFLFLIPLFLYFLGRVFIPPQVDSRVGMINLKLFIKDLPSYANQLKSLFFIRSPDFWFKESFLGLRLIFSSVLSVLAFIILMSFFFISSFFKKKSHYKQLERVKFWLATLIVSLLPLLWQRLYFPFRTLVLPLTILTIVIGFYISFVVAKLKSIALLRIVIGLVCVIIIFFLSIQVKMLDNYSKQYAFDKKMVRNICYLTRGANFTGETRTKLLIYDFPNNSINSFISGDYLFSIFHFYWSAEAFLDLNACPVSEFGAQIKEEDFFISRHKKEDFLDLRPLTIVRYTKDKKCEVGNCFNLVRVLYD